MKMNVFANNELKMNESSSTEVRNELVHSLHLSGKSAKQIIAIAMKQGCFTHRGLRVVVIGHAKHHGRKHSLVHAA